MDAMLDAMTPGQFYERMVADVLDPIDDSWEQAGMIAATIHNEVVRAVAGDKMTDSDIHEKEDYQPNIRVEPKEKPPSTDDDLKAVVQSAQAIAGF